MRYIKKYELYKESKQYNNTNTIYELCVAMLLINPNFLDNILDRGLKARYSDNSAILLTDLKNLVLAKNRLHLGKFEGNRCTIDSDVSKMNNEYNSTSFDIDKDWNKLIGARTTARNIQDKLIANGKLTEEQIKAVYWIGPNKTKEYSEDIVIELHSGIQYSFFLNKNLNTAKTISFNKLGDELVGDNMDNLFGEEYISKWDKLTQEWVRIIYENSNSNIKLHIEKFIDPDRIDSIGYFEYFDIKHRDQGVKNLGEYIPEINKNILYLNDLLSEVYKNSELFNDYESVKNEWNEKKIYILNSRILEHIFTESIKKRFMDSIIDKDYENYKIVGDRLKMRIMKIIVNNLGSSDRILYYLGNNGNTFYQVPARGFFRKYYDDFDIRFDYHVTLVTDSEVDENNDFNFKIKVELDKEPLMDINMQTKWSGGEMSGKLSTKFKIDFVDDFNHRISNKVTKS